ncbi:acyl-CoA dehydrogenase family protein [Streptosporangium sp. NPDC006013]|uniref:acyl-CoA dehydrogenase family protein n=1 Tax=Streptosporangium sp. NPDC006013 TaxID=3155596 RepID=UPI0033A9126E
MEFLTPPPDHPSRLRLRQWLRDNPDPDHDALAGAGYVAPHWPTPYGLDAGPLDQLGIDEELRAAGVSLPVNPIGIGWAGPTILVGGTQEQKDRYLRPMLAGREIWCQLFSEPGHGSDLANLSTRAVRDGDHYVVNGQKLWTSDAHRAHFGILIVRTDPDARKHRGISYLICPMDTPGITVRPVYDMTGTFYLNEVFFDDVRIPAANLVGAENDGWRLAKVTLGNERVSLSGEGALWGSGPTAQDLVERLRERGGVADPILRQRVAQVYIVGEILRLIRLRTVAAAVQGRPPGPEASIRKALSDEHGQEVMAVAKELAGSAGMLLDHTPFDGEHQIWDHGFLFAPALTVGGGTAQIQRNIIAEAVLGLPREIDVEAGLTWNEARAAVAAARR